MRAARILIVAVPLALAGCGSQSERTVPGDPAAEERYADAVRVYQNAMKNAPPSADPPAAKRQTG